jgi:hypothetical protein
MFHRDALDNAGSDPSGRKCKLLDCRQQPSDPDDHSDERYPRLAAHYSDDCQNSRCTTNKRLVRDEGSNVETTEHLKSLVKLTNQYHNNAASRYRRQRLCHDEDNCITVHVSPFNPLRFLCTGPGCRKTAEKSQLVDNRELASSSAVDNDDDDDDDDDVFLRPSQTSSRSNRVRLIVGGGSADPTLSGTVRSQHDVIQDEQRNDEDGATSAGAYDVARFRLKNGENEIQRKRGGFVDMTSMCLTYNCAGLRPGSLGYLQCVSQNRCSSRR